MKIRRAGAYRTRHMQAWTVTDVLGRVLVNAGTHEEVKDAEPKPVPQPTVCARFEPPETEPKEIDLTDDFVDIEMATVTVDKVEMLRHEAEKLGIHVDKRWGVTRLEFAIRAAKHKPE